MDYRIEPAAFKGSSPVNGHFNGDRKVIKCMITRWQREQVKFTGLARGQIGHAISDLKAALKSLPK